jgi:hypothetical protein
MMTAFKASEINVAGPCISSVEVIVRNFSHSRMIFSSRLGEKHNHLAVVIIASQAEFFTLPVLKKFKNSQNSDND